jgi:hypothetical protein
MNRNKYDLEVIRQEVLPLLLELFEAESKVAEAFLLPCDDGLTFYDWCMKRMGYEAAVVLNRMREASWTDL